MTSWKTLLASVAMSLICGSSAMAEGPQTGGVLRLAPPLTFKTLDPVFGNAEITDRLALNQIYDPLIRLDDKGAFVPMLATEWSYNADNTVLALKLREGVVFHDGTPFNADAVIFNLERLKNSSGAMRTGTVDWMKSVEKAGDYDVLITVNAPSGYALSSLAAEGTLIISPAALAKFGEDYGRHPVGTGPFRFVDWVGAEEIILEKNPDYWMKDEAGHSLPYLDGVEIRSIPNYATAILELETGGIDVLNVVNPQDFERVRNSPELGLLEGPQVLSHHLTLNVSHKPFDNQLVRQALAYGIDRATLAKAIAGEYGLITPTHAAPSEWQFDPSIPIRPYDPAKARALLAEAGYPDGVSFEHLVIQREPDVTIGQILQQMLKEAGFDMKLTVLERQAWIGRVINEGTFDTGMSAGQQPRVDPHDTWGRSYITEQGGNWMRHADKEMVDLIYKARDTVDQAERKALYRQIAEMALDRSYQVYLFQRRAFQGVSKKVHDLGVDNGGAWVLTKTWKDQ